ncbi:hypothetical protein LAZ67_11002383, partial [Cordylochernes scorpioides]
MQISVQLERVGKPQPADRVATSSSAGIQDCRNLRLFVTDKNTGFRFLVDSGADISIIPPKDKNRMPSSDYKLYAANGTEIVTYGTKVRNLDIGLRRQFQWPFVIANTNRAIIGADFLNNFGLIIDIKNKRLIDGITNLSIRGVIQSISDMGNISTLNSSSKVSAILTKYPNLCRPPSDFVEAKHSVKDYIPTRGQPIHSKARRLDSQRLTLAKAEFQYMLNNGIIRPSNSPWASPLHLVSKKDESLRPCGDYRRLNAVTLPDRYPIPRLDDFHHILKGTRVYSKIDLCKAFYQIPIAEEDKPKTAIITPFGLFEFNVMSFGLRNATATFQRFMHEVLRNLDFAFVYLDDILVASKTEEEHYSHLETLFSRLNSYGLRINLSKSKFLVQEIDFLGYLITSHGVKPLPTKVKAILEYKKPKTVHELRIFLGMLNFYRTFLNNAAETQVILHEYLRGAKKNNRSEIKWTKEAEVQFEKCKQALANTALLAYPDTELPISLCTDASDRAVGSVLQQLDNNNWKPIAFFSKKLNPAQCNYSTYDRELLAIYLSIKFFKHLLEAREFTILTDHKPLIYAFKQKNEKASPRQLRHLQYISQFSTDIKYIKGTDNIVADALSRVDAITTIDYEEIAKEQTGDSELQNLISKNTSLKFKQCPLQSGNLLWCDVSTNNIRPFIPIKFRMMVFRNFHELSHPGIKATTKQLTSRFIWPNMNKYIRKWAQACVNCQKCKVSIHTKSEIGKYQEVDERFSVVHIDLIGPLPPSNGNIYCLTCIDRYTSWMEVIPLPDMKSETVARAFYENWIVRFGAPHTVISDQGKQFTSQLFKDLTTLCGIKLRHSTAYHPQCNGKIERLHRTIKTAIRAHNSIKWTETLPTVLLGLRAVLSTKITTILCLRWTDRVKKPLEPPYEGPFPVLERTDKYFTLKVKGKNVTTSIDRLRPAYLLADSDNITAEHPTATRPIVSGALPSTSSQQNTDPPDVEKQARTKPKDTQRSFQDAKKNTKCHYCHKIGHWSRECRKRLANEKNKSKNLHDSKGSSSDYGLILCDNQVEPNYIWYADNGASCSMTFRREWFKTYTPFTSDHPIYLGDNSTLLAEGMGDIEIQAYVDGGWYNTYIRNVLYSPQLKKNLYSLSTSTRRGFNVIIKHDKLQIFMDNDLKAVGVRHDGLYRMLFKVTSSSQGYITSENKLQLWHERLAHLPVATLREMATKGLVDGLQPQDLEGEFFFCEGCQLGKAHRKSCYPSDGKNYQLGEFIYADICGPMQTQSLSKYLYFCLFKDYFSGYRHIYFIKNKSDVLDIFKEYATLIYTQTGNKIKVLRTDNALEFKSDNFADLCKRFGIIHEFTAPYVHEQIGRIERDNRTIVEAARSMLNSRNLPGFFWAEACNTATHILNRSATKQTPGTTPYELYFGTKPNVANYKIFGCNAYMHIPKENRKKWDNKSIKLMFLGYENTSKNFRLWDWKTRKIRISKDVTFDEKATPDRESTKPKEIIFQINSAPDESPVATANIPVQEMPPVSDISSHPMITRSKVSNSQCNFALADEPSNYIDAITSSDSERWKLAMDEEIDALNKNKTWTLERLADGHKPIGCKWVYKIKTESDGTIQRFKARLVAKGYSQIKNVDYFDTFSPVVRYDSLRILLSHAASERMFLKQFDVKTAFLNGELEELVYLEQPEGYKRDDNSCYRLHKSLYGLKQSSRNWNKKFTNFLNSHNFKTSDADPCIFIGTHNDSNVILALYVDDGIILSKDKEAIAIIMDELEHAFEITSGSVNFFVGLQIEQSEDRASIFIHQSSYIDKILSKFNMADCIPASVPMDHSVILTKQDCPTPEQKEKMPKFPFREAVGSLMFASCVSRPDITYAVSQISVQLERVGKPQPADRVATSSSAGIQDCRNLRLFVTDKNTGFRFLVDSGADISIIPPKDKNRMPSSDYKLYAANGTEIVTYGTKVRNLDIGLRRQFQWPFVIANTNRAIIGADFLNNFGLIIDIKNKRLIDGITNLSIRGVIQSISDMGNISTLNSSSKVSAILTKYPNLCRPPSDFVEAKHSVKDYIPTRGQPIHSKARRLDSQRLTLAKAEFQYMLNNGIIRPSNSPWASPLHLVSKKDESLRPCGDYRRLNAVTLPDRYPIPRLDDFHHILKGTRVYSKIDLCKAFYQIPIAEEDKPKTAIITPFGLFEFNVMSFGLRNATATFQRFMHEVLRNLDFAFVYLDDILVASKTEEEHYSHLETLFSRLNSYGLRINLSKSKFLVQEIDFLGYLITSHGVKPLPTKVKAILEYKKPKTVHELRIFLGMLNFYRTFLNNAAETQVILHEYLRGAKKNNRSEIKWTKEAEVQFEKCKQALANTALLAYPDTELPISLCTDASDRAVGSVLQQLDNNNWKPIAFFSKKLNPAQCNYSTYDRELLAIYLSIKFFKHLLEAREFTILTDHKPLIYAFKQKNEKASPRQLRHLQYISQFSTDIKYIKGTDNIVADALSRVDAITTIDYEEIAKEQTGDSELQNLISKNTSLKFKQCPLQSGNLLWCDVSTNNIRPFIPIKFRMMVFRNFHELSHPGIKATTKQLTSRFIWPNMNKYIRKWAQACVNCQKCKVSIHTKSEIGKYQEVDERFSVVHIDLIGPLPPSNGNIYCLTCIDRYTSWMEVIPLPDMKSETVARAFYENWIVRFGAPHTVISDQGKQFTSQLFKDLTTLCGIKLRHSTAYHPQCNGKIERLHRTIKTAIRAHNSIKWTETLPTVLLGLRAVLSTKITTILCLRWTDRVKKPLEPPYEGPFPVLERTDKYFTLKVKGKNVTTSIDRLRPAYLLADSDNITAEHPTATRPIVSGALPSTSSQQNTDPPDVE